MTKEAHAWKHSGIQQYRPGRENTWDACAMAVGAEEILGVGSKGGEIFGVGSKGGEISGVGSKAIGSWSCV
jgi:hypothetical protein